MSYTLVDILEKLRDLEKGAAKMYEEIAHNCSKKDKKISIAAKVLRTEELRHIEYYGKLIEEAKNQKEVDIDIDFDIYDKAYSLMNEFKTRLFTPNISSVSELIEFAYDFENANTALLLDIRGRLVRDINESTNYNYLALTEILLEEQKHAESISLFKK